MITLAEITLVPGGIITWAVIGLVAGFLTRFVAGGGYGLVADMGAGLTGAVVGGLLCALFAGAAGFWGSALCAFLGACAFISVLRVVARGRLQR